MEGEQRICPRCGAPYDAQENKCPYCLTSYFDMSAIDISECKPFYLKLKFDGMVFTSLVKVSPDVSINVTSETTDYYDGNGRMITRFMNEKNVDISMGFHSVAEPRTKTLYTIIMEDN